MRTWFLFFLLLILLTNAVSQTKMDPDRIIHPDDPILTTTEDILDNRFLVNVRKNCPQGQILDQRQICNHIYQVKN
nr:uncharacterized protein LOC111418111 isoform X2 [Onthophagus taurus]